MDKTDIWYDSIAGWYNGSGKGRLDSTSACLQKCCSAFQSNGLFNYSNSLEVNSVVCWLDIWL